MAEVGVFKVGLVLDRLVLIANPCEWEGLVKEGYIGEFSWTLRGLVNRLLNVSFNDYRAKASLEFYLALLLSTNIFWLTWVEAVPAAIFLNFRF